MKSLLASMATLLLFSLSARSQTVNTADEAAIRDLVKTIEEGWTKKDGNLFAKPFAENADYVIINGMHIKGRTAIANGHQNIFNTIYKETNIKTLVQSVRFIRPDIAIVHFSSHLTGKSRGENIEGKGQISLTVEKTANGWQIVSFQNTSIESAASKTSN